MEGKQNSRKSNKMVPFNETNNFSFGKCKKKATESYTDDKRIVDKIINSNINNF